MNFLARFRPTPSGESSPSTDAPAPTDDPHTAAERVDETNETVPHTVAGERGVASIRSTRSLQSRLSNFLAGGLLGVITLGFLTWYYTHVFDNRSRAVATQRSAAPAQVQGEMVLPPLGRVDSPMVERVLGPPPAAPGTSLLGLDDFQADARGSDAPSSYMASNEVRPAMVTSASPTADRRLSGPVFVSISATTSTAGERGARDTAELADVGGLDGLRGVTSKMEAASSRELDRLLTPTRTPAVQATVLPTQRLLLPKGTFLDCTLETAIDSSLPGMTTCITATDTFGADGNVVLLERGTKLVGETRGDVRQGSARVYVLWTEARTPDGVVVPLASPGTDELGRAGLPGDVNRHFWERFGAAILVSVIDGVVQGAIQRSSSGDGAVIVNPSTSQDVMTEVLRSTITIPPTVTKSHGDRIAVVVARDLDFRSVYELRPAAIQR